MRTWVAVAFAVVLSVATAGCTEGTPPAAEAPAPSPGAEERALVERASERAETFDVVRVRAHLTRDDGTTVVDMRVMSNGTATGTIDEDGERMTVRRRGQSLWFKGTAGWWETQAQSAAEARALARPWYLMTLKPKISLEQSYWTDWDKVLEHIDSEFLTPLRRVGGVSVDGVQTVGLSDAPANPADRTGDGWLHRTVYLTPGEHPLPVRVVQPYWKPKPYRIDYSDWGKNLVTVSRPRGRIVDAYRTY